MTKRQEIDDLQKRIEILEKYNRELISICNPFLTTYGTLRKGEWNPYNTEILKSVNLLEVLNAIFDQIKSKKLVYIDKEPAKLQFVDRKDEKG